MVEGRGPFWSAPVPPLEEVVRRAPFPLYGLSPDWTGPRSPVGCGVSAGEVIRVSLGHGAPDVERGPTLVVETLLGLEGEPWWAPFRAALHLDGSHLDEDPALVADRHQGRWRPLSLAVDGRQQVVWFQEVDERWAAFARVGPVRVVVAATRWDGADVRPGRRRPDGLPRPDRDGWFGVDDQPVATGAGDLDGRRAPAQAPPQPTHDDLQQMGVDIG